MSSAFPHRIPSGAGPRRNTLRRCATTSRTPRTISTFGSCCTWASRRPPRWAAATWTRWSTPKSRCPATSPTTCSSATSSRYSWSRERFAVDLHILAPKSAHVFQNVPFGDVLEIAVRQANVLDRRGLEPAQFQGVPALLARSAADIDVAHHGPLGSLLAFLVVEIDLENGVRDRADYDVPEVTRVQISCFAAFCTLKTLG